jgi:hypothetical protein
MEIDPFWDHVLPLSALHVPMTKSCQPENKAYEKECCGEAFDITFAVFSSSTRVEITCCFHPFMSTNDMILWKCSRSFSRAAKLVGCSLE